MYIALSHHSLENLLQQPQETKTPSLCEEYSHEIWKMEENPNHYYFSSNNVQAQGIGSGFQDFSYISSPFMLKATESIGSGYLQFPQTSEFLNPSNCFHDFHHILSSSN